MNYQDLTERKLSKKISNDYDNARPSNYSYYNLKIDLESDIKSPNLPSQHDRPGYSMNTPIFSNQNNGSQIEAMRNMKSSWSKNVKSTEEIYQRLFNLAGK